MNRHLLQPNPDERLELLFRHAGLTEKQAKLYRLLLETGEERPSTLSKKSGLKRANTYALLIDLERHGLVTKLEKDKVMYFRAEHPRRLTVIIESRQKEAAIAGQLAHDLLPNLTSQYNISVGKPTISYYEGEEGLKSVFRDIYAPKNTPIYGCVDLEIADTVFPAYIAKSLIPLRVRNKLFAYSFIADSPQAKKVHKEDQKQLRTSILLSKTNYPLPAEIDVYDDKIALLSFEKGKFIGMIIQNQAFAATLLSIFKRALSQSSQPKTDEDP